MTLSLTLVWSGGVMLAIGNVSRGEQCSYVAHRRSEQT
jgi:hypothetical protein